MPVRGLNGADMRTSSTFSFKVMGDVEWELTIFAGHVSKAELGQLTKP